MDGKFKKYFLELNDSNILGYIIAGMISAGISKINIITNNTSKKSTKQKILNSIPQSEIDLKNLKLNIVENKIPSRENGYSLLLGLKMISSDYVVMSMADHIFSKNIFSQLKERHNGYDVLLATDPMQGVGYYDLHDATKVYGSKCSIIDIGKDITYYNRLDMGAFILKTKTIRDACREVESNLYKFGVTNIILSALKSDLNVGYCDFPNTIWLDVDNHAIYYQLREIFNDSSNFHPFGLNPPKYKSYLKKKKICKE